MHIWRHTPSCDLFHSWKDIKSKLPPRECRAVATFTRIRPGSDKVQTPYFSWSFMCCEPNWISSTSERHCATSDSDGAPCVESNASSMHQSIPAGPSTPPPSYCGAFSRLVSPGGGAFANFVLPGGRAFANPGAIPDTHRVFYWERKQIGSSVKDRKNWRGL